MYGYIYLTTNLINGKKYIGKHKSDIFDDNYYGSGKILSQALLKEGKENFKCEILCECDSEEELNSQEAIYIEKYNAVESNEFYNLKPGGLGKSVTGVIYITNGTQCKKVLPEELEYYFNMGYYKGGPKQSLETRIKRANSNRGKKHPTAGPNISKALKGKKLTQEHKDKLSKAKLGKPCPNKRKILCVETNIIYDSLLAAAQAIGAKSSGNICSCLKGHRELSYGYHWKYVN